MNEKNVDITQRLRFLIILEIGFIDRNCKRVINGFYVICGFTLDELKLEAEQIQLRIELLF